MKHSRSCYRDGRGEGGRQLHDDLATCRSRTSPGGKRRLIWEGGSAVRNSNELRPPDPGGGVRLTTSRTKTLVPPADTHDRGGTYEEHVCFPLAQGSVEQPVLRPASCWSTRQSDRQLVHVVKVSAVMIDVILEPVDSPVPAGLAGANSNTNNTPPLVRQLA